LPTSVGAATIDATFGPLVADGVRRRAALGNSLAVPDVRWILERVKASVQGALELHHWPEPGAANDNWVVNAGSVKAVPAMVGAHSFFHARPIPHCSVAESHRPCG